MTVKSVVIIGANRGIGLGFVQSFTADRWSVHATKRVGSASIDLDKLSSKIQIHLLDVQRTNQISRLADLLIKQPIDLLIHNAGTYGTGMEPEQVMAINSKAPINVANALLPSVLISKTRKVVILTSQMGARNGGSTPTGIYGKSKCFLNDNYRSIEPTWRSKGITSVLLHPGWVATDMGGVNAPVSIRESVKGMRSVIENLEPEDAGKFLTWKGQVHSW